MTAMGPIAKEVVFQIGGIAAHSMFEYASLTSFRPCRSEQVHLLSNYKDIDWHYPSLENF